MYNNKDTLEADIKYYWNVYVKDYSEIVVHSVRKRINACIKRQEREQDTKYSYLVFYLFTW